MNNINLLLNKDLLFLNPIFFKKKKVSSLHSSQLKKKEQANLEFINNTIDNIVNETEELEIKKLTIYDKSGNEKESINKKKKENYSKEEERKDIEELKEYLKENKNDIIIIGNGGAGAIGFIKALADKYNESVQEEDKLIVIWRAGHSFENFGGLDFIDAAITYEPHLEYKLNSDGLIEDPYPLFFNHFDLSYGQNDIFNIKESFQNNKFPFSTNEFVSEVSEVSYNFIYLIDYIKESIFKILQETLSEEKKNEEFQSDYKNEEFQFFFNNFESNQTHIYNRYIGDTIYIESIQKKIRNLIKNNPKVIMFIIIIMTFLKVYSKKLDEWDEFKKVYASRYNHSAMGEKDVTLFVEAINRIFFLLEDYINKKIENNINEIIENNINEINLIIEKEDLSRFFESEIGELILNIIKGLYIDELFINYFFLKINYKKLKHDNNYQQIDQEIQQTREKIKLKIYNAWMLHVELYTTQFPWDIIDKAISNNYYHLNDKAFYIQKQNKDSNYNYNNKLLTQIDYQDVNNILINPGILWNVKNKIKSDSIQDNFLKSLKEGKYNEFIEKWNPNSFKSEWGDHKGLYKSNNSKYNFLKIYRYYTDHMIHRSNQYIDEIWFNWNPPQNISFKINIQDQRREALKQIQGTNL